MKNLALFLAAILFSSISLFGQNSASLFLGLQPSVTVEPFYEKGEFDLNLIPIVIQVPVSKRIDLRLTTISNYHFGEENQFSDLGAQLVAPVFFRKKDQRTEKSSGFYLGPVAGFGRNLLNDHYTMTLALEPGYMLKTEKRFTLAFGVQVGGSRFLYDEEPHKWVNHFGVKVNIGFWL